MLKKYKPSGFSLIELMIALLLGTLVSIAAMQLFLSSQQSSAVQKGVADVQEQGRFVFDYLSRDLMGAGYSPEDNVPPFQTSPEADVANNAVIADGTQYDEIVVRFEEGVGCDFEEITNTDGTKNFKRYFVDNGVLRCEDSTGGTAQVLIENIDAFQVLYGVDKGDIAGTEGDGFADYYLNATEVKNIPTGTKYSLVSIRFALMIASNEVVSAARSVQYSAREVLDVSIENGTDNGKVNFADGRLRRMYVSTVSLRNPVTI